MEKNAGTGSSVNKGGKQVNLGLSLGGQRRPAMLEARPFTVAGGCSIIKRGKEPLVLSAGPSPSLHPQGPSRAVDSGFNYPPPIRPVHPIRESQGHGNGVNPPRSLAVQTQLVPIHPKIGEFRPTISVINAKRLARRVPRSAPRANRRPAAPKRQQNPVGSLSYEPLPAGAVAQRQYRHIRPDNGGQPAAVGTEYHNVLISSNYSSSGFDRRPAPGIRFRYPNPALPASSEPHDAVHTPLAIGPMILDGHEPQNRPAPGSAGNPIVVDEDDVDEPKHRAGKEPVEGSSARPVDVETTNRPGSGEGRPSMQLMGSARAVGDDGRVVKGFVFKSSRPGGQVRIVCDCHCLSHSPGEFLGHAGASDVSNPFKSITVSAFHIS